MICTLCGGRGYIAGHPCAKCLAHGEVSPERPEITMEKSTCRHFIVSVLCGVIAPPEGKGGIADCNFEIEIKGPNPEGVTKGEALQCIGFVKEALERELAEMARRISKERKDSYNPYPPEQVN